MKLYSKSSLLMSITLAGALLAAHAIAADAPTTVPSTQPTAPVAFNQFCPVDTDKPVDPKVTYEYNGKIYGFCCEDCVKDFKKDPEKYADKAK